MMNTCSRRRLLANFATSSLAAALGGNAHVDATVSNRGLVEACCVAWKQARFGRRIVDLRTARCTSIHPFQFPDTIGLVVVWDDLISDRDVRSNVLEIQSAISKYFDVSIAADKTNACVHFGKAELVKDALGPLFIQKVAFREFREDRVAIVDLGSCGLTRLDWHHLIPFLRSLYGTVVGLDYSFPEFAEVDPDFFCAPHFTSDSCWRNLASCDHWAIASDVSLSQRSDLSNEDRKLAFTSYLCDFAVELGNAERIEEGFLAAAQARSLCQ
jgi:hypothetical protein